MNVSLPKLLLAVAVAVSCLAASGKAYPADKYDNSSQAGDQSRYRQLARNGDDAEDRREGAYDEHRSRVANHCDQDWSYCANDCNRIGDGNQRNLCMADCNNNLNQCLLQR